MRARTSSRSAPSSTRWSRDARPFTGPSVADTRECDSSRGSACAAGRDSRRARADRPALPGEGPGGSLRLRARPRLRARSAGRRTGGHARHGPEPDTVRRSAALQGSRARGRHRAHRHRTHRRDGYRARAHPGVVGEADGRHLALPGSAGGPTAGCSRFGGGRRRGRVLPARWRKTARDGSARIVGRPLAMGHERSTPHLPTSSRCRTTSRARSPTRCTLS